MSRDPRHVTTTHHVTITHHVTTTRHVTVTGRVTVTVDRTWLCRCDQEYHRQAGVYIYHNLGLVEVRIYLYARNINSILEITEKCFCR